VLQQETGRRGKNLQSIHKRQEKTLYEKSRKQTPTKVEKVEKD